ncbi:MAG: helix-turn-helix domain-containing protein [Tateyamaria sp.]
MAQWVRAHIDARIEERDLRDLTAMRPLVFRRAFVARAGMPPLQFVTWTRVDVAVRLLMETRFSVSEIAFVTGLESELGLSRAFRRTLGVGPHALRSG